MPKDTSIKSVLIIGSGPIVIGQACEFDYAGSQSARSIREEGIEVILINSNPATIMTDPSMADHVYLLPLTICVPSLVVMVQNTLSVLILTNWPPKVFCSIMPTHNKQSVPPLVIHL